MSDDEEVESQSEEEKCDDDAEEEVEEGGTDGVVDPTETVFRGREANSESGKVSDRKKNMGAISAQEQAAQRKELATAVSISRILTDEDFKRIETAQMNKQITSAKRKRAAETDSR